MGRLCVDAYLARRFDLATQNCWHLARDAWLELTGVDLGQRTPERITSASLRARFDAGVAEFERLPAPVDPCLVLMRADKAIPHVGVFYRARLLQMAKSGPTYLPLAIATRGFPSVEFYR